MVEAEAEEQKEPHNLVVQEEVVPEAVLVIALQPVKEQQIPVAVAADMVGQVGRMGPLGLVGLADLES
jgi:hypothetical protein